MLNALSSKPSPRFAKSARLSIAGRRTTKKRAENPKKSKTVRDSAGQIRPHFRRDSNCFALPPDFARQKSKQKAKNVKKIMKIKLFLLDTPDRIVYNILTRARIVQNAATREKTQATIAQPLLRKLLFYNILAKATETRLAKEKRNTRQISNKKCRRSLTERCKTASKRA